MGFLNQYASLTASVIFLSLIFYPFELIAPAEKHQHFAKRLFNLAYVPVFLLATLSLQPILNVPLSQILIYSGGGVLPQQIGPKGGLTAQILFAIAFGFLWDLWQYWLHRLQHTVPWLWETHRFHHSETALNSTTQARNHLLSYLLSVVFYLPVLILLGPRMPHSVAVFVMFRLWGLVNHANVRLHIGIFTPLISAPQWHRIHHSSDRTHYNKNFATFFPFIDIIFGTYYRPQRDEFPPSGLPNGEETSPIKEATISPLTAWYRATCLSLRQLIRRSTRSLSSPVSCEDPTISSADS